jgi:uncharacterized protein YgbK (DUF1537 family)
MEKKILIVADDLTGAGDTGVQFSKSGAIVKVIIGMDHLQEEVHACDVLVVDLESRMDTPQEAYRKHFSLGRMVQKLGDFLVYKKLDSTFRGNIGAEMEGLMDALQVNVALLAPALPASARTVVNGEVYVRGVKLAETEAAADPRTPVKYSSIAEIIGLQCDRDCRVISTDVFSAGVDGAAVFVSDKICLDPGIFIFDSREEKDLEHIAGVVERLRYRSFLVAGSSGLARHLGRTGFGRGRAASEGVGPDVGRGHAGAGQDKKENKQGKMSEESHRIGPDRKDASAKVVFVFAGSVSGRSQAQVQHVLANGDCVLIHINGGWDSEQVVQTVRDGLEKGRRRFIFTTALSRADVVEAAARVAGQLGELAAALIRVFQPSGILLTGGETAIHTVLALRATGIRVVDEILPGIQYGYLTGPVGAGVVDIIVVTKAGGFGEEDTISKILEFLNV